MDISAAWKGKGKRKKGKGKGKGKGFMKGKEKVMMMMKGDPPLVNYREISDTSSLTFASVLLMINDPLDSCLRSTTIPRA